ncbi:MAG: aldehyde dehydrogenase family protein [Planctomycetota bacterium]
MSRSAIEERLEAARAAQAAWWGLGLKARLQVVRRLRGLLAEHGEQIAWEVAAASGCRDGADGVGMTLAAEVVPLADAAKWLEKEAGEVLGERKVGVRGRPLWLWGCRSVVKRLPWGVVLVIGAGNYPLMLAGVQAMQGLVAGNAVVLKPGRKEGGGLVASGWLERLWREAGLPAGVLTVIGESVEQVGGWMSGVREGSGSATCPPAKPGAKGRAGRAGGGVDKVVLTGSSATGRAVMRRCAETLTPVSLELSGVDGCVVLPGADVGMAAEAIAWGLRLNSGATCIAPRRVLVHRSVEAALGEALRQALAGVELAGLYPGSAERCGELVGEALAGGAELWCGGDPRMKSAGFGGGSGPWVVGGVTSGMRLAVEDSFGPTAALMAWETEEELMELEAACPYGLGLSVFGPAGQAMGVVERFGGVGGVGSVVVNDLIAPTADPRLPFGGTGESGFGVTRGAEGLAGMTRPVSVTVRGGRGRPHYAPVGDKEVGLLGGYLRLVHAVGWRGKARAVVGLIRKRRSGV